MVLKRYLGLGRETTFGTAVAATRYIETVTRILPDQGFIIPDPICDASYQKYALGPFRDRGPIGPFAVTPDNIGELINAVMGNGSYSKDNPEVGVYTHAWLCSDDLDSYTSRIGGELEERILAGMLVNKLTFKASHGDLLKATAEVVGPAAAETTGALASLTRADLSQLDPFVFYQASGELKIDAVDKSMNIFDFEIAIDNSIPITRGNLDSRYFSAKRRGLRSVTGKISAYFDDDDEYDRFIAGTPFALIFTFTGATITGAYKYYLKWFLPKVVYLRETGYNVQPVNEPLVVDAPFRALWNAAYTELQIGIQNAEAADYT